jgi:YegS/Rv2252/BmrU family lipid kinase
MSIGDPNTFHRPPGSGSQNTQEHIALIVNPRAGAGKARTSLDALRRAADKAFASNEVFLTEAPLHATELAREAARAGADIVAAVGGDGTCHEVVNGLIENRRAVNRKTIFTVIPMGTGGDLARTLQMPKKIEEALWLAGTGITLPSDLGLAQMSTELGEHQEVFVNVAGVGMNGAVGTRANQSSKRMGGRITFLAATLATLKTYQASTVTIRTQGPGGPTEWRGQLLSAFVANGAFCGGGMWVGKGGTMQDGLLDLTILPPAPLARQLIDARHLYTGQLGQTAGAVQLQVERVEVIPDQPIPIDLDGESPGAGSVSFEVLPRALNIRAGWLPSAG